MKLFLLTLLATPTAALEPLKVTHHELTKFGAGKQIDGRNLESTAALYGNVAKTTVAGSATESGSTSAVSMPVGSSIFGPFASLMTFYGV